ncbi:hypothetical protein HYW21_07235 [Candidatus Woesearchaeota archaeon]|nr:hypothetical protein [Candidatus Woesearchaeota archaeon]
MKPLLMRISVLCCCLLLFFLPVTTASLLSTKPITVDLEPLDYQNVVLKERDFDNIYALQQAPTLEQRRQLLATETSPVERAEQVLLILERISTDPGDAPFQQYVIKKGDEKNKTVVVPLIPGTYRMEAQLLLYENVTIPEYQISYCKGLTGGGWKQTGDTAKDAAIAAGISVGASYLAAASIPVLSSIAAPLAAAGPIGIAIVSVIFALQILANIFGCLGDEEKVTVPSITLNPALIGGAVGNITITKEMLAQEEITFYVFKLPLPIRIEEMNIMMAVEDFSQAYPYMMKPS